MCLFFKFLFWLVPFQGFRALVLRIHFDRCIRCQEEYEIEDLTKDILTVPDWINAEPSLWPQVKHKMIPMGDEKTKKRKKLHFKTKWYWAAATLFIAAAVVLIVWTQQNGNKRILFEEALVTQEIPQVTIRNAEVNGKKATSYVYQTQEISFIWFSETDKTGE